MKSAMRGVPVTLLDAVDADGSSEPLAIPNSFHFHKISITGAGGVDAGTVTPVSSPDGDYSGTWSPITNAIDIDNDATVEFVFEGIYQFIRLDVASISNGTVTATYVGS